jgi:hypothetical protein
MVGLDQNEVFLFLMFISLKAECVPTFQQEQVGVVDFLTNKR